MTAIGSYSSLAAYGVKDNSQLKLEAIPPAKFPPAPPSIKLDEFATKIFRELGTATDPRLIESCRRLLNRLPTDPTIITTISNMRQFLQSLSKETDGFLFRYRLLALFDQLDQPDILKVFKANHGCEFIVNLIQTRDPPFKGIEHVLLILQQYLMPEASDHAAQLIPRLLLFFPKLTKGKRTSLEIIVAFVKGTQKGSNKQASQFLLADPELFANAIAAFDGPTYSIFQSMIWSITPRSTLARLCFEHISIDSSTSIYFLEIFAQTVSLVNDTQFSSAAFTACLQWLPRARKKIQVLLSRAVSNLLTRSRAIETDTILPELLHLVFYTDEAEVRRVLTPFCAKKLQIQCDERSLDLLRTAFNFSCDRWNYHPDAHSQSETGYLGLRNLGSTCYMNAVFQQLFHIFPFRYLVVTTPTDDDAQKELKELFTELLIGKQKSCDTQPFCNCWKGWDNQIVSPRVQQDACEFLQLFLGQLPTDFYSLFKGSIKHTINGITVDFSTESFEDFYAFTLQLKQCPNVEASFASFLQEESFSGDNQYCYNDQKSDAVKFCRIQRAPPVLVLQLARFEFAVKARDRVKIHDRYEFSMQLNLGPYMVDPVVSLQYELSGVVLHNGTAKHGHYTSLVLIDGAWIAFNDMEVSEIKDGQFEELAFGKTASKNVTARCKAVPVHLSARFPFGMSKGSTSNVSMMDFSISRAFSKGKINGFIWPVGNDINSCSFSGV
jgi:hypothetical protein